MDDDFALALQLNDLLNKEEEQYNDGLVKHVNVSKVDHGKPLSIVDDSWELLDPVPNIRELFVEFNGAYFDGMLAGVEVKWSSRMTLCAGVCCYEGRGGLCSVKLSEPLLKLRPRKDLVNTLLHEMIHALLFVTDNNKDHDGHGDEFHKHMYRINKQTGSNITVYHTFHDEVNLYRQHWWRCDGPCVKRPPYYGIVRRAMNRPPSSRDPWFNVHKQSCGGTFTKIKEPEKNTKKSGNKNQVDKSRIDKNKIDKNKNDKNFDATSGNSKVMSDWLNKKNESNVNTKNENEKTLTSDSFWTNKALKSNVKGFNEILSESSSNEVFSASSRNSSSDVHGFKMSARKTSTKEVNVFSGHGFKMNSSQQSSSLAPCRETFLKKVEGNMSSFSSTNKLNTNVPKTSVLSKRKTPGQDSNTEVSMNKKVKTNSDMFENNDKTDSVSYGIRSGHVSTKEKPDTPSQDNLPSTNQELNNQTSTNQKSRNVIVIDDVDDIVTNTCTLVECPACPAKMPEHELNKHLDTCLA